MLSELLTNNAAAALMYPIASSLAERLSVPQELMSVAVMLGGSAGWILPFSYQCNLMVYSAGNYRTADFVKIGAPLTLWLSVGVAAMFGFASRGKWYVPLAGSLVALVLAVAIPLAWREARAAKWWPGRAGGAGARGKRRRTKEEADEVMER